MANLEKNEQIRNAINLYCTAKQISKNELATKSGVSGATLSKIENGKWDDIDEKLWRKIEGYISDPLNGNIFSTSDFNAIQRGCKTAQKDRLMIGILADTGVGKTTALNVFSRQKNVFYVPYAKTMAPKHFFAALLKEMGIAFEGNIYSMVNKISDELNTLKNPLLIIDEAGKLTHTMLMYLHELRNLTMKNCGIVLAGMPYFRSNLIKFSNKQKEGIAEFYRRINVWHELQGLSKLEIKGILDSNGITEPTARAEMANKKRFGDLQNAILLYNIQNAEI